MAESVHKIPDVTGLPQQSSESKLVDPYPRGPEIVVVTAPAPPEVSTDDAVGDYSYLPAEPEPAPPADEKGYLLPNDMQEFQRRSHEVTQHYADRTNNDPALNKIKKAARFTARHPRIFAALTGGIGGVWFHHKTSGDGKGK